MSLYDELAKIGQQVKSQLPQMKNNETATVHVSVLPFIRALGYNTQDLSEVYPEYAILNMDAVDYAVLRDGEPIMFLEAKKAGENLGAKHWKQLFEYFNADKACIAILTNGLEYRFYADMEKPNIMDKKPFLEIDLLKLDKRKLEVLQGFTKTRFDPTKSIRFMKVRTKVEQLLDFPDEWLIKHVMDNIHEGPKWKNVIEEYRPLVKRAIVDYVKREVARHARPPKPGPVPKVIDPPNPDPILPKPQTWLDGSIRIPVFASWNDNDFDTTLRLRGKITNVGNIVLWDGKWLNPMRAGEAARRTVDPNTKGYVNGMTFWSFRDPADERLRPIIDLLYGWHDDWDLILRVIRNATQ